MTAHGSQRAEESCGFCDRKRRGREPRSRRQQRSFGGQQRAVGFRVQGFRVKGV